jgi:fibronectin type 3 domain-containing protein
VNWSVSGTVGGNSSVGTITSAGLYTAPSSVPSAAVVVMAQSSAAPSSSASASVTVTQPVSRHVNLNWTSSSSSVAGYNVYRGSQAAGPFTKINSSLETATVYTDSSVTSGQTYYYTTTAVDSAGMESSHSNVAQATIP